MNGNRYQPSITGLLLSPFVLVLLGAILFNPCHLSGQSAKLINDGAEVVTTPGVTVYTRGEVRNQVNGGNNGTITNDGTILTEHPNDASFINQDPNSLTQGDGTFEVQGDWVNNGLFNGNNGEVILYGANQLITGDSLSSFNDLTLTGTGTKTQTLDAEVTGVLDLTDRRLHTDTNSMFVLNSAPGALNRAGGSNNTVEGFVSSDTTGWLVREMAQSNDYLFPVGDSIGTARYRPVELTPDNNNPQTVRMRFKNSDPTPDGYDVTSKATGIGPVNSAFYWHIDRPSGSDPMGAEFFYDGAVDSADMAVHWETQWEQMGTPTNVTNPSPALSSVSHSSWNDFSPTPFDISTNPFTVDAGPDDTVCVGDTVQLNATVNGGTGPFGFDWTPSTYLDDSTLQDPQAQGVMDTITYYVTAYDSATGTTSQADSVTIYVSPDPNVSISPANPATCVGDSSLLEASGADSYVWEPDSTLSSSTGDSVYASPSNDETIIVTGTDSMGCTAQDTVTVTIEPTPGEPVGDITPDTICEGDTATITASGSGGSVTYSVYDSATGGNYLGDTPLDVSPSSDSTYYIEASLSGSGCNYPDRDTVTLTVNPAPASPTLSLSPDTICAGDSTTLSATGSGAGVTYEVYDDSIGGNYLGDANLDLGPDSTSTYYVDAVDANGCTPLSGKESITVHVNPLPTIVANPDTAGVCVGDTAELTVSGADNYSWSPNDSLSSATGDTVQAFPDSSTVYTVTGTDSNGCVNDTDVVVILDSVPSQPTVDITPDTICQGDSAVITASGSGSNVDYQVYDASVGGTYLGDAPLTVSPMSDSTYYIEATLPGGGCSYPGARDSVELTVVTAPADPTLTAIPDTVCPGDTAVIDASGSGAGVTYEVYDAPIGGNYLGDAPLAVTPGSSTDYYVAAVNNEGCIQLDGRDTITVHTYPEPIADAGSDRSICPGENTDLIASGGSSYTWSTGASGDSINVSPDSSNSYWVNVQNAQGCSDQDTVRVNVVQPGSFIASDDADTLMVGESILIDVIANDTGSVGDSTIISGPERGSADWADGGIDYIAPEEEGGSDSLTYVICNSTCPDICDTAVVRITIEEEEELFIPNGISVDGDGKNDVFRITGLERYPENNLTIFNRWGDEVFFAEPYENDWAGETTAGDAVEGTYFYVLDLGPEEEKKTGFIELKR